MSFVIILLLILIETFAIYYFFGIPNFLTKAAGFNKPLEKIDEPFVSSSALEYADVKFAFNNNPRAQTYSYVNYSHMDKTIYAPNADILVNKSLYVVIDQ